MTGGPRRLGRGESTETPPVRLSARLNALRTKSSSSTSRRVVIAYKMGNIPAMPKEPVRYLVFSASLRTGSFNTKLAQLAAGGLPPPGGDGDVPAPSDLLQPSSPHHVEKTAG